MTPPIDITPDQHRTLLTLLESHVPNTAVWAYGSRAKFTSRPNSDLDLVVFATEKQMRGVSSLREAIEESSIPFQVDLHVWEHVPDRFKENISSDCVVLVEVDEDFVPEGWVVKSLGEFIEFQRGFDLPKSKRVPGDFPVIASTGPVGSHSEAKVKGPGLVIGRSGSIGGGQYIVSDFWPLNTTLWVKKFNGNDVRFSYYLVKTLGLDRFNAGSGVPTLNRNHIHPLEIRVPERVSEQKAIAHILGTLDDKIELNRRMNATLEEMARALFKSWFVDFDPVHRNIARAQGKPPTCDEATEKLDALFPSEFQESELGEIPKGWEVREFDSVADIRRDTIKPQEHPEESFAHYSIPAFDDGEKPVIERGGGVKSNKFEVPSESVLLSKLNPRIPRVWMPETHTSNRAMCSTEFLVLVAKPPSTREFVHGMVTGDEFQSNYATLVTGTSGSHQRVTPDAVKAMSVVVPDEQVVELYSTAIKPILASRMRNKQGSETLASLRDTLLPKLLSGDLRMPDANKMVEGV